MKSREVVGSNVAKIATLFPQCVTERLNKDGKPELAIDFTSSGLNFPMMYSKRGRNAISSRGLISVPLRVLPMNQQTKRFVPMSTLL